MIEQEKLVKALEEVLKLSKPRNFTQSVEVTINFKPEVDVQKSKLNLLVHLPKGRGKDLEVCVFADGDVKLKAKELTRYVYDREELQRVGRREMKKLAKCCYWFLAQADLMPVIGKTWGVVLGPRGKMPQPIPPSTDVERLIQRFKNTIRLRSKKLPVVSAAIGVEGMRPEDLADNLLAVLKALDKQVPFEKVESIYAKTSMGPAVRLY